MKLKENTMGLPAISSDMTSADLAIIAGTAVDSTQATSWGLGFTK